MAGLTDYTLLKAASSILVRSDRQEDIAKLRASFVDFGGILAQLDNENNQILMGRRGTGKTHVLKVLQAQKAGVEDVLCVYLDARTLGSAGNIAADASPEHAGLSLFRDILDVVYEVLLNHMIQLDITRQEPAFEELVGLTYATHHMVTNRQEREIERRRKESGTRTHSAGLDIGSSGARVEASIGGEAGQETELIERFRETEHLTVDFPAIDRLLTAILDKAGLAHLYIIIDEWSSIDVRFQPYLADCLRRSVFAIPGVTVKIASLEYRSAFSKARSSNQIIGLEVGGDISTTIDLDDYYVYDRNPRAVTEAFANLLYRHLSIGLPENYMRDQLGVADAGEFQTRFFTSKKIFGELVHASEGVPRDLMNLFVNALNDARRRGSNKIDKEAVTNSARTWYQSDKELNLTTLQSLVLSALVAQVAQAKQSPTFLLDRTYERHEMIQSLLDHRVLHIIRRGYSDLFHPGVQYNIYALDYGIWVNFQARTLPVSVRKLRPSPSDFVAPFGDSRQFRRIVLDPKILALGAGKLHRNLIDS